MAEVKLHGFWSSPFSCRVIWALTLKGVEYEYIEEDLLNKSELLLKYNPIYKKIPVLVHDGKPIAESLVILEYIEETWPVIFTTEPLLDFGSNTEPNNILGAVLSFFFFFLMILEAYSPHFDMCADAIGALHVASEEEKEKAAKELLEVLKILEDQALGDKKFSGGDNINLVDISYGPCAYWLPAMEEAVGVKVLEPSTLPKLHAWAKNFIEVPVIKESIPDYDKIRLYESC
ncbi:hypothetical protein POTOM_052975 [Populus tomentosa]|uniref:glutathione transferase n=1 Tax=Populus tomentosa TaxID=118781 RepID=A0A8X8C6D6_POPTO|nr:hypothetical protein POTOM_052975 [Populus tomentosa]